MLHALCRAGHCRDMGGPLPFPGQPCCCGTGCASIRGHPTTAGQVRTGQDSSLKAALCRGFRYGFPEQEQQEHSPPWGKAALLSGGTSCPVTAVRQSQLCARAACCCDSIPSLGLPACCIYTRASHGTEKETQYTETWSIQQGPGQQTEIKAVFPREACGFSQN